MHDKEDKDIERYKRDLEESLNKLEHVKEERKRFFGKANTIIQICGDVENQTKRIEDLQLARAS